MYGSYGVTFGTQMCKYCEYSLHVVSYYCWTLTSVVNLLYFERGTCKHEKPNIVSGDL